jgi:DNA modification methylase
VRRGSRAHGRGIRAAGAQGGDVEVSVILHEGDCRAVLATLAAESVQCVVTSPPYYGLRDYGCDGQIGLEQSPAEHVAALVEVFREVKRVLRKDGTLWLNLGDSYNNFRNGQCGQSVHNHVTHDQPVKRKRGYGDFKEKDLLMIPNRVAIALQDDGWWVRSEIIWAKAAPMPESVRDRPTCAHEKVWLLTKAASYFYDADAVAEPAEMTPQRRMTPSALRKGVPGQSDHAGVKAVRDEPAMEYATRNLRNVWHLNPEPFAGSHFATMPATLAERCIKAGSRVGDTVLDPFAGAGTTLMVADRLQRHAVGIELNPEYAAMARKRITGDAPLFAEVA